MVAIILFYQGFFNIYNIPWRPQYIRSPNMLDGIMQCGLQLIQRINEIYDYMSSGVFGKGSSEGLCMLWGEREMVWMTQLQSCKVITVCSLLKNIRTL